MVVVPTCDGVDGQEWADLTASLSRIDEQDVLLAIATEDREYGLSVADGFALSDDQVDQVVRSARSWQ